MKKLIKLAESIAHRARQASHEVAVLSHPKKVKILRAFAKEILKREDQILMANARDIRKAKKEGLAQAMTRRLELNPKKLQSMAQALKDIARLPDPLSGVLDEIQRPNGLVIRKKPVPLGVMLMIYESRPNVTSDCAALALKSGNAIILKGGKEAQATNQAIHRCLKRVLLRNRVPHAAISLVPNVGREVVHALFKMKDHIDVVIPRGGEGLIRQVAKMSQIPVIKHYKGVCHTYIDAKAGLSQAMSIAENAKTQNPSVCNAMETLLVHEKIAKRFLPEFLMRMIYQHVDIRGCSKTSRFHPEVKRVSPEDWGTEYLDMILSVRVVPSLDAAIQHIRRYGSGHSDAIVSRDRKAIRRFVNEVDSACVFSNASTRFSDGGEFGMGAEIGISTDKLHARGPVGLRELTTYKYIVTGNGQIRE